jgi:hypothetical protein
MGRDRALKVVLVVVGLIFCGLVYPLTMLAARDPSANRSLIAFTAWSSFAHAGLMAVQAFRNLIPRGELWGVAVLVIIGVALIGLAPAKWVERVSAIAA